MPLGVVIGRFQTPYLTRGHTKLIDRAIEENSKLLILIGVTVAHYTDRNPLTYNMREHMIKDYLKKIDCHSYKIEPLYDQPLSDADWSKYVDEIVGYNLLPDDKATLYAGRDNSIEGYYSGKHKVCVIDGIKSSSGTEMREKVRTEVDYHKSEDFRRGVIYACHDRYPTVFTTVDVALISGTRPKDMHVLMGRKGDGLSFIGGFLDPQDKTLHHAAIRETKEETGLELKFEEIGHVVTKVIEDERYAKTKDKIMTHLFTYHNMKSELIEIDESKITDKEFKGFEHVPLVASEADRLIKPHRELFREMVTIINFTPRFNKE